MTNSETAEICRISAVLTFLTVIFSYYVSSLLCFLCNSDRVLRKASGAKLLLRIRTSKARTLRIRLRNCHLVRLIWKDFPAIYCTWGRFLLPHRRSTGTVFLLQRSLHRRTVTLCAVICNLPHMRTVLACRLTLQRRNRPRVLRIQAGSDPSNSSLVLRTSRESAESDPEPLNYGFTNGVTKGDSLWKQRSYPRQSSSRPSHCMQMS